jgi:ABC-type Fe3+-citrate transport system substrate-binding protein
MWGLDIDGIIVHPPMAIPKIKPDIIIICNYRHDQSIYNELQHFEKIGIRIIKLHRETDIPWVF